jgi:hypothetical protein
MLLIRCQNGVVLVRVTTLPRPADSLRYLVLNDGTHIDSLRTDAGLEAGLIALAAKAVALRGAVLQVVDLSEVV